MNRPRRHYHERHHDRTRAIIAAGSVVTKDVAPYEIVGGVPAKRIRLRFDEALVERLLRIQWWQYDRNDLTDVPFNKPEAALDEIERRVSTGCLTPRVLEYQEFVPAPPAKTRNYLGRAIGWVRRRLAVTAT